MSYDYSTFQASIASALSSFGITVNFAREDGSISSGDVSAVFVKAKNAPVNDASGSMFNSNKNTLLIPATAAWEPLPGDIVTYTDHIGSQTMRVSEVDSTAPDPTQPLLYSVTIT